MATRILLLRHGENTTPHLFNGAELDSPLSERGRRQAEIMARVMLAEQPQAVISSAMLRAVQTASPIAQACGLPLKIEPDLHERRVGSLSGKTWDEGGAIWQRTLARWMNGQPDYDETGGESFVALQQRVLGAWSRLVQAHAGQTAVVVAHGHVCRCLLLSILPGWSVARWREMPAIRNVSVTELVQDGQFWQAVRIDDLHPEVARLGEREK